MGKEVTATLRIRTPIWTGDIDSKTNLLKPTGIMGSLRWWTEAILRGMGRFACDPVEDSNRCPKPIQSDRGEINQYCPVCLIFGATGIRRLFKVDVSGGERAFSGQPLAIKPSGRTRGWYLGSGLSGNMGLTITALDKDFRDDLFLIPLAVAANLGAVGAKSQHGYGVVELLNYSDTEFERFSRALGKIVDNERLRRLGIEERHGAGNSLPDIKDMFFAKVEFEVEEDGWWKKVDGIAERKQDGRLDYNGYERDPRMHKLADSGSVPISPATRNWLRYEKGRLLWETGTWNNDRRIENWLFGTTRRLCGICFAEVEKDRRKQEGYWCPDCRRSLRPENTLERVSSKINISCAYHIDNNVWEFRMWGWIPENKTLGRSSKGDFLDRLKDSLEARDPTAEHPSTFPWNDLLGDSTREHRLTIWREFNSARDTITPCERNAEKYLQSLLIYGG